MEWHVLRICNIFTLAVVLVLLRDLQHNWSDDNANDELGDGDLIIESFLIQWLGSHNVFLKRVRDDIEEGAEQE